MSQNVVLLRFLYGTLFSNETMQTFRFPPGENFATYPERTVDELTVYVDEESPLRFIPPLPPFTDVPRGWFMLHDLLIALPLSVFVLTAYVNKNVDVRGNTFPKSYNYAIFKLDYVDIGPKP
ncbi:unnamed protein product [Strongylus vulgaris]|uniref:Uncharacterized protein n=1 Tax=Strongylus vulgaris TaxID=40348 RepID=A0A3P7I8B6_STRVU|nr:unnamed protein product [Strongylus vulgaris]